MIPFLVGLPMLASGQVARVTAPNIEGKFVWESGPDFARLLQLEKNKTYRCVSSSGWSGESVYANGTYKLADGRITFTIKHQSGTDHPKPAKRTFDGKQFYVYRVVGQVRFNRRRGFVYYVSEMETNGDYFLLSAIPIRAVDYRLEE